MYLYLRIAAAMGLAYDYQVYFQQILREDECVAEDGHQTGTSHARAIVAWVSRRTPRGYNMVFSNTNHGFGEPVEIPHVAFRLFGSSFRTNQSF